MKLKNIFKWKNVKAWLGYTLISALIIGGGVALNNALNDDNVKTIATKKINLNKLDFTTLTHESDDRIFHVAEVGDYFVILQDSNLAKGDLFDKDGKITYTSSVDGAKGGYGSLIIIDSVRNLKYMSATMDELVSPLTTYVHMAPTDGVSTIVRTILSDEVSINEDGDTFETEYNFFSYQEDTSGEELVVTKVYDYDYFEFSLINEDLTDETPGVIEIYLK